MEDFDTLMKQAVSIKSSQSALLRKRFDALPLFLKCGLYYTDKFANVRKQDLQPRLASCELLKNEGNLMFSQQKYDKAARTYEQALTIFRYITSRKTNWKNEGIADDDLEYVSFTGETAAETNAINAMLLTIYLNLAATYLKLQDYPNAIASCDEALKVSPDNLKAFFRRAKARTSTINTTLEDYELALQDLRQAYQKDPKDPLVIQELQRVKDELERYRKKSESLCKGIFNKGAGESEGKGKGAIDVPAKEKHAKEHQVSKDGCNSSTAKVEKLSVKEEKIQNMSHSTDHGDDEGEEEEENLDKLSRSVNKEIEDLGRFLEQRGSEIVHLYQSTGRMKEAEDLKEKLKKAMNAKRRMEKMSTVVNFEQPTNQMVDMAKKFGLDLSDSRTKVELLRAQAQQIKEIRSMIDGKADGKGKCSLFEEEDEDDGYGHEETREKVKQERRTFEKKEGGNTVVINHNYINATINNNTKIISNVINNNEYPRERKSQHDGEEKNGQNDPSQLICDLLSTMHKRNEEDRNMNSVSRIMNLVIIAVALALFILTIVFHSFGDKSGQK